MLYNTILLQLKQIINKESNDNKCKIQTKLPAQKNWKNHARKRLHSQVRIDI
jgi:hypothetical protein